jgi:hypothetical protein
MKKMIANVLVACTLMNGAAFAQEPKPDAAQEPAPTVPAGCTAGVIFSGGELCPEKEDPRTSRPASPLLGWLGLSTMLAGGAIMVPWSEGEDWEINGQSYCYSEGPRRINFERGACGVTEVTPTMIKAGLITVGVGGVMALLGWRRVAVAPTVTKDTVGASATVKW